jgi:hypothetical protein
MHRLALVSKGVSHPIIANCLYYLGLLPVDWCRGRILQIRCRRWSIALQSTRLRVMDHLGRIVNKFRPDLFFHCEEAASEPVEEDVVIYGFAYGALGSYALTVGD